ncbi:MobA/MobL family protein, partial [Christensenellaceae bacterium OttesenSCG-928-K19]|nr:MobA/MobL family protein [Christensenellaceae bacterium OttesenSCG-928-K19]
MLHHIVRKDIVYNRDPNWWCGIWAQLPDLWCPINKQKWGWGCSAYKTGCKFSTIGTILKKRLLSTGTTGLVNPHAHIMLTMRPIGEDGNWAAKSRKPLVLTVNGHTAQTNSLTVSAAPVKHAIVATAGTGGSIAPSGTVMVAHGGSQTFKIEANGGYKIREVVVDGRSVGAVSSHTFNNVTAGHTIQAVFEKTDTDPNKPHTYQTLQHDGTGVIVKANAASNAVLVVTQGALHDEGTCPACDSIRRSTNMIALYDISIQGDYSGNIEVSIPVPSAYNGQTVVVRHCKGSQVEEVVLTVQDGYVTGT